MTRRDFQALSAIRLREARHLVENRCWDGAYYLGGYAVECALKACIAKQTERHTFPANRKRVEEVCSHDFPRLLKAAGLESVLAQVEKDQPESALNWQVVRNWLSKAATKGERNRRRRSYSGRWRIGIRECCDG